MPDNNAFKFTLSVSDQFFIDNPKKDKQIMSSITFKPQEFTVASLLRAALNGRVFCPTFKSDRPDGSFSISEKKRENFLSTSTLFFDFDKMDVRMDDYIDTLEYKPSFGYTTYTNGADGYRYRLGYIFPRDIKGEKDFNEVYNAIVKANNFPIESPEHGGLDTNTMGRCEQCYFGTYSNAEYYYQSYATMYYSKYDFEKFIEISTTEPAETIRNNIYTLSASSSSITIDEGFLNDFYYNDDFIKKYLNKYYPNYKASLEPPLILDDSQMFYSYPEYYVAVKHIWNGKKELKWQIGSDRKKKMFIIAHIMLYNNPSLTIENLLFNLRLEREWYFVNSDNKISNDYLLSVAKSAMTKPFPINQTKHGKFRVNKEFWNEQGVTANQAKNIIKGLYTIQKVKQYFNPYLSYKQNIEVLKANKIEVSERTLKRMVSKGEIEKNNKNNNTTYLSECHTNVTNAIIALLKEDGSRTQSAIAEILNIDIRTVKRYFKDMSGKSIIREGNNRTGRWVVIDNTENGDKSAIENVSILPNPSEQTILS